MTMQMRPKLETWCNFGARTQFVCQDQMIMFCGCRYKVTLWLMMSRERNRATDRENKDDSI